VDASIGRKAGLGRTAGTGGIADVQGRRGVPRVRLMRKFGVSEGPIASAWKMSILKSTGEHYLTTLLFEGIDAQMSEEELALSRSTPSATFPPA
jgi:hypothetical protein